MKPPDEEAIHSLVHPPGWIPDDGTPASTQHRPGNSPVNDAGPTPVRGAASTETSESGEKPSTAGESGTATPLTPSQLIQRHQKGVWRYLRMLGCDDATADDLTQETFLRVLRRDNFVQHNDSATAGYLRRTAYNLLVSRHRKLGRTHTVSEPTVLDETWDRWAGKDLNGDAAIDALRHCLQTLTERARLALRMRFADEASRVEIGDALGISDHGARNLMQRAKQQLRNCVETRLRLTDQN